MIVAEASLDDFRDACRKFGMRTLRESGLKAIHAGLTSIEEIVRETISTRSEPTEPSRADRPRHDTTRHRPRRDERLRRRPSDADLSVRGDGPHRARGQGHDRRLDPGRSAATDPPEGVLRHQDLRAVQGGEEGQGGEEEGRQGARRSRSRSARSRPSSSAPSPASSRPSRTPACRSSGA